jgi:hypothetical protein
MPNRPLRVLVLLAVLPGILLVDGCAFSRYRKEIHTTADVKAVSARKSPYLNAHMKDGSFIALSEWRVHEEAKTVSGFGRRLDVQRRYEYAGNISFPMDSVVVFEAASVQEMPPAMRAITIVLVVAAIATGVALAAIAIACIGNPKCFGSCPTFYLSDGEKPMLMAEGFSASIAPALEATDIDALYRARPASREVDVTMTNEALETHAVRFVHLLAAPKPEGARIFATPQGEFVVARDLREPSRATGGEGDILGAVRAFDGDERTSAVDSTDLARRETVDLEFTAAPGETLGLVVASRQTLLTTYLFYETLAAMGGSVGKWIAMLERGDSTLRQRTSTLADRLGGVEVLADDGAGGWRVVNRFSETGPIATDVRVLPLPDDLPRPLRLKLRVTRGHYRFDWIALARLGERVEPVRLDPYQAVRDSVVDPATLATMLDAKQVLTTGPGDRYTFRYRLPGDPSKYELFLESRGWYIEWMRQRWVESENPMRLAQLMLSPRDALRDLAPAYAREQTELEDWFWRSRYARP